MATVSRLLRQRDFSLFVAARFFANIGAQMQTVALGLQVYAKTSDPFDLGMVGLSQFLPFIVFILPAGQLADRKDRRLILAGCYAVQCLCALALLIFTWAEISSVWPIFGVMTILGGARAFSMPAVHALLPNLLPREFFQRAVALNSSIFTVSTITGPVLGGLLFLAGPSVVYAAVACMVAASVAMILALQARQPAAQALREGRWAALLSGLQFVRSKSMILGAISLDLFAVLFGGATALLPVYASDVLHVGPTGLGLLRTAPGFGSMVCALILWNFPMVRHVGRWLFGSIFVFGAATMVFGLSTHFAVSLIALTVLGVTDMTSVYVRNLLVQLQTPDAMRGRVSAVSSVFVGASNEFGEFESGVTAAWWGAVRAVVVGGAATMMVAGIWSKLFPELAHLNQFPEKEHSPDEPAAQ